jgi:glyoxylase-like metal-dependent hydrolase (beta-lactamase superfamily II)
MSLASKSCSAARRVQELCWALASLVPIGSAGASEITLAVSLDPATEELALSWSGGEPDFQVFRSSAATNVAAAANLAAVTSGSAWTDAGPGPAPGAVFHYLVTEGDLVAGALPGAWISGQACGTDPVIQIHGYNADTYILRQSLCTNFEGPFVYLLFGADRVLMLDTGATASLPLAATVYDLIDQWLFARGRTSIRLVVAHSHAHGDHVACDFQFQGQSGTTVVGLSQAAVAGYFGLAAWPQQIASYDLGGRIVDVVPIPGHHSAHIALYDRQTALLLTGDTLYPGRLYISNFPQYLESIERLVGFIADKPVVHVLGTHIEMTDTPYQDYPFGATVHPDEHRLELGREHLLELLAALEGMAADPHIEEHPEFIVWPL